MSSDNNGCSTSGNAADKNPWPESEVRQIIRHPCCTDFGIDIRSSKHRCDQCASAFVRKLKQVIPGQKLTEDMVAVAEVTAGRGNGDASVLVYSGHDEKVRTYKKIWHAVIERFGDAAVEETELSVTAIAKAAMTLYRYSPNQHPGHEGIDDATLYVETRRVFKKYDISRISETDSTNWVSEMCESN